jgi:hypothetical protein
LSPALISSGVSVSIFMPDILAAGKNSSQLDGCYGRLLGMLFVWLLAKLGVIDQSTPKSARAFGGSSST